MKNWHTSTVFVAQVREPPYVGKIDSESDNRQKEVDFAGPSFSAIDGCVELHGILHHPRRHVLLSCNRLINQSLRAHFF